MKCRRIISHLLAEARRLEDEGDKWRSIAHRKGASAISQVLKSNEEVPKDFDWMSISGIGPSLNSKIQAVLAGEVSTNTSWMDWMSKEDRAEILKYFDCQSDHEFLLEIRKSPYYTHVSDAVLKHYGLFRIPELLYPLTQVLETYLGDLVIQVTGGIRRKNNVGHDIDYVAACSHEELMKRIDKINNSSKVQLTPINQGESFPRFIADFRGHKINVDFRLCEPRFFASMVLYLTGSKEHNIRLRSIAKKKGFLLNEYGLTRIGAESPMEIWSEMGIFEVLGEPYIKPEYR